MNSKNNKNESLIEYIDSLISELNIVRAVQPAAAGMPDRELQVNIPMA